MKKDDTKKIDTPSVPPTPQVDVGEIMRDSFISRTATTLSAATIIVPIGLIWLGVFFYITKSNFYINLSSTMRGLLFALVIVLPVVVGIFLHAKLRIVYYDLMSKKK